jgi:hypothetical protein
MSTTILPPLGAVIELEAALLSLEQPAIHGAGTIPNSGRTVDLEAQRSGVNGNTRPCKEYRRADKNPGCRRVLRVSGKDAQRRNLGIF